MLWSSALSLALSAGAGLAAAHGGAAGSPRLFGGRKLLAELRAKGLLSESASAAKLPHVLEEVEGAAGLEEKRDDLANTSGRCGGTRGACATGYCCSAEGWCGLGEDYCTAPDCQINYGSGCDANQKPDGVDTSTIPRTKVGKVAYGGVGIYDCVNKGDIAITFDDGPYNFTDALLDKLKSYNAKATFFITGNNLGKGMINDPDLPWRAIIQRMAAEGHQVASHTWSHQNYSQLTTQQFQNQILWNEIAFNDILGYIPTYMRPPYSICPATCESQLAALGYHIVYFDLDTEGYLNDDPTLIQNSKDIWDEAIDGSSPCQDNFLNIEHDIHYQTVYNLTDYFLTSLFANGYRSVTVGECIGDPAANWYRAGSSAVPTYTFADRVPTGTWSCLRTSTTTIKPTTTTTKPSATPTATSKISSDGTCGTGVTCAGSKYGNCCSANGYCGASADYCGKGCQKASGVCYVGSGTTPQDASSSLPSQVMRARPRDLSPDTPLASSTTTSTAPTSTATLGVSVDGSCGVGTTCQGSLFGNCCSAHGFCGADDDYCGDGCQPAFGSGCTGGGSSSVSTTTTTTKSTTSTTKPTTTTTPTTTVRPSPPTVTVTTTITSTSTPKPPTTTTTTRPATPTPPFLIPSRNGRCGPGTGETCTGSGFGPSCCAATRQCSLLCLLDTCLPSYGTCIL